MEENKSISVTNQYTPSRAEIEIIQGLANDFRAPEVATQRGVSRKTIDGQIASLKKKCGKKTVGGLISLFYKNQLID